MELFHISEKVYTPGETVRACDFGDAILYHQNLTATRKDIDDFLSAARPEGEAERHLCIYAFDKMEYCVYFRKDEILSGKSMHLYKCEMNCQTGHPMFLVGKMEKANSDMQEAIRSEYWKPTINWKVLEYMAEEMTIIQEIPITQLICTRSMVLGNSDYSEDYISARKMFS